MFAGSTSIITRIGTILYNTPSSFTTRIVLSLRYPSNQECPDSCGFRLNSVFSFFSSKDHVRARCDRPLCTLLLLLCLKSTTAKHRGCPQSFCTVLPGSMNLWLTLLLGIPFGSSFSCECPLLGRTLYGEAQPPLSQRQVASRQARLE